MWGYSFVIVWVICRQSAKICSGREYDRERQHLRLGLWWATPARGGGGLSRYCICIHSGHRLRNGYNYAVMPRDDSDLRQFLHSRIWEMVQQNGLMIGENQQPIGPKPPIDICFCKGRRPGTDFWIEWLLPWLLVRLRSIFTMFPTQNHARTGMLVSSRGEPHGCIVSWFYLGCVIVISICAMIYMKLRLRRMARWTTCAKLTRIVQPAVYRQMSLISDPGFKVHGIVHFVVLHSALALARRSWLANF